MNKVFESYKIEYGDDIYNFINNKSYIENPNIKLEDLRLIKLLYYDFNKKIKEGKIIVNKLIEEDILDIFTELYKNKYQLNSVNLVEDYWCKDSLTTDKVSMANNNSSAFNYRIIDGKDYLSYHALGLAVDINPINNPYITNKNGKLDYDSLSEQEKYYALNRDKRNEHVITHDDLAYKLFIEHGFEWGGDWNPEIDPVDYQHFEKPVISNKILVK
ncbi:MAG: M15 family metallopeptidase [Bacilli bacterium]|nr:M15 family metallopeptidase [Bacilli bacterium]